jgi:hypothetical protein
LHDSGELADDHGEERPPCERADVSEADAAPPKSGRMCSRVRFQNSSSTNVCSAMPRVAVPPSSAIMPASQSDGW